MSDDNAIQLVDPYIEWGLDRSSLPELKQTITSLKDAGEKDAALDVSAWVSDPMILGQFIETVFHHAENGYVQLRMFIDGEEKRTFDWPWKAVPVSDRIELLTAAISKASRAALSKNKVNFCPPPCTFIGPEKATKDDVCESYVLMVECDERPTTSLQTLEELLGTPTMLVKSGGVWTEPKTGEQHDKLHVYWRLTRPARDAKEHEKLFQARVLAMRIVSSDPTATPSCHPLRWPGSWHKKGEARLSTISGITDHEVELDQALTTLREAAVAFGVELRDDKPINTEKLDLRPDVKWDAERDSGHILNEYRALSSGRHHALSRYAVKIAMSALNNGYDLSEDELEDIVRQLHDQNPPTSRYKGSELARLAREGLGKAINNVADDPAYKRQEAEWKRIRHEIEEDAALGQDAISRIRQEIEEDHLLDDGPLDADEFDPYEDDAAEAPKSTPNTDEPSSPSTAEPKLPRASMFRTREEHKLLPPPKWLVQDLIPENADIVLYAPWGHLKSFVAVDLAYSIVTACTALGLFEVKNPGPVIYFCGEGHGPMAKYRATAWEIAHGFEPYDDPRVQNLHIADGVPATEKDKVVEQVIDDVEQVLNGQKARLTIVDTMSRALGRQKENDVDVANGYLDTLKKIRSRVGGSTLTLAHAGKDLARGIRGSSGYGGGFDTILLIDICEKDDERVPYISLLVQKQKDGEDGQRYFWRGRRVPVGEERESLVLDALTEDEWNTFQFSSGRRAQSVGGTTKEIIEIAVQELKPGGGTVNTADLCRKISAHTHQSEVTVRKQLDRGKKTLFKDYISPDGKGWCLPGCHLEGCRETLTEQMPELRREETQPIFTDNRWDKRCPNVSVYVQKTFI